MPFPLFFFFFFFFLPCLFCLSDLIPKPFALLDEAAPF
jgi:hypothetical protein